MPLEQNILCQLMHLGFFPSVHLSCQQAGKCELISLCKVSLAGTIVTACMSLKEQAESHAMPIALQQAPRQRTQSLLMGP